MSIIAIRQQLLDDLHSLVTSETVDRKIISAIRFMRDRRMWWSERTFQFTLTDGRATYKVGNGPPADMAEIVGRELWVLIGGSEDSRVPCYRVPTREFDYLKQDGTGESQPEYWDFSAKLLRFYPTPSSSTDVVQGRYVVNIDVPVVRYEAGAYAFYSPDGLRKLSSTELGLYENDWTDPRGAGEMVRARAAYLLYKETLHDAEMAEQWLTTWLEHVAVLDNETEQRTAGATEIVGCLLD